MSFIFCSRRFLIFCCSSKGSIRKLTSASAVGAENKANFKTKPINTIATIVIGVVLTVTTWAAPPKPQSVSAAVAKGAIYRPALWKVY